MRSQRAFGAGVKPVYGADRGSAPWWMPMILQMNAPEKRRGRAVTMMDCCKRELAPSGIGLVDGVDKMGSDGLLRYGLMAVISVLEM